MSRLIRQFLNAVCLLPAPPQGPDLPQPQADDAGSADSAERHRQYRERLARLKDDFARTPLGQTILDYLEQRNHMIMFCDSMHPLERARATRLGIIMVNPSVPDGELAGFIAHEARHMWQFETIPELDTLPPRAALAINAMMEADAHAFQQKYLEDLADVTGDTQERDNFIKRRQQMNAGGFVSASAGTDNEKLSAQSTAPEDFSRYAAWMTALSHRGHYTTRMLDEIAEKLEDSGTTKHFTIDDMVDSISNAARGIGGLWPYDDSRNYLTHLDGRTLAGMMSLSSEDGLILAALQKEWDTKATTPQTPETKMQKQPAPALK